MMAPTRARQESTEAIAGSSKGRQRKRYKDNPYSNNPRRSAHEDHDALPGVQKLKSSLRQAKRLLAKDNVAADVRVETERRVKALEADLARAELFRKERQHATRYHKVKFFERRKVIRKINQTKRELATADGKEKERLQSALADLRVDLNYILHFPKTMKYVSLFPPDVRGSISATEPAAASSDENEDRTKVRKMIRQQMSLGEFSAEPESELGKSRQETRSPLSVPARRGTDPATPTTKAPHTHTDDLTSDDFFGEDDEDGDSQQSESPGSG